MNAFFATLQVAHLCPFAGAIRCVMLFVKQPLLTKNGLTRPKINFFNPVSEIFAKIFLVVFGKPEFSNNPSMSSTRAAGSVADPAFG